PFLPSHSELVRAERTRGCRIRKQEKGGHPQRSNFESDINPQALEHIAHHNDWSRTGPPSASTRQRCVAPASIGCPFTTRRRINCPPRAVGRDGLGSTDRPKIAKPWPRFAASAYRSAGRPWTQPSTPGYPSWHGQMTYSGAPAYAQRSASHARSTSSSRTSSQVGS